MPILLLVWLFLDLTKIFFSGDPSSRGVVGYWPGSAAGLASASPAQSYSGMIEFLMSEN